MTRFCKRAVWLCGALLAPGACSGGGETAGKNPEIIDPLPFEDDDGGGPGPCRQTKLDVELRTPDILFLIDRTESMQDVVGTDSKWDGAIAAIGTFVGAAESFGIGAGITFFPEVDTDYPAVCEPMLYTTPDVVIAPVGSGEPHAATLIQSMQQADPLGTSTPTYAAIDGALSHAAELQKVSSHHEVVVVLTTDGLPSKCDADWNSTDVIAEMVAEHYARSGVELFIVAVKGATVSSMSRIAEAGGTGEAFDATDDIAGFGPALQAIRQDELGCEIPIPPAPAGVNDDTALITLTYFIDGTDETSLSRVAGSVSCGNSTGWHFDDPADPTSISMCPVVCKQLKADPDARLEVGFGCRTKT